MESHLHQCQNLLTTLSFVASDMIYFGFYLWRTVIRLKYKTDTMI
jgi:hypothetical protein